MYLSRKSGLRWPYWTNVGHLGIKKKSRDQTRCFGGRSSFFCPLLQEQHGFKPRVFNTTSNWFEEHETFQNQIYAFICKTTLQHWIEIDHIHKMLQIVRPNRMISVRPQKGAVLRCWIEIFNVSVDRRHSNKLHDFPWCHDTNQLTILQQVKTNIFKDTYN